LSDARRLDEPLDVVAQAEHEKLALDLVPVGSDPAEAAEPVVEGLRAHADGRLRVVDEGIAVPGHSHDRPPR
jgi:hypothetical protein